MSRLEELIQELYPDGVEYKRLGDVCDVLRGKRLTISQLSDEGKYPVLHGGSSPMGYYDKFNRKAGTTVVVNTGNAGCVFYYEHEFWSSDACFSLYPHEGLLDRFLYHYVLMKEPVLKGKIRAGAMPTIDALAVESLFIPVPPLEVQHEIVQILDSFTDLTAELTAELTARKQQYEYYRDKLLVDNESMHDVSWKPLGDICSFVRGPFGGSLKKDCFVQDGYVVYEQQNAIYNKFSFRYHITEEKFNELKRFEVFPGDLIMSCSGTMGKIAIVPEDAPKGIINQALLKITVGPELDNQFLKYCFEALITKKFNETARGGAIKNVASVNELKQFTIPVPSLGVQKRLVQILNNFASICSDLTSGLPAEIEARQKQYEYYRDKLLNFKEKAA